MNTKFLPGLFACFMSLAFATAESKSVLALREVFLSDIENAKIEKDFVRIVESRLACQKDEIEICEWEISEIMFRWLTLKGVSWNKKYGTQFMFQYFKRSIDSGAASVMGTNLASVYGFGLFGVPKDDQLAICWARIAHTTFDKTEIENCKEMEVKKYGKVWPWLNSSVKG
jgi:hypothetical protein